jgi:hemolysin-activating ACP:hemolysin acyltransferase
MERLMHYSNLRVDGRCAVKNYSAHEVIGMLSELMHKLKEPQRSSVSYLENQLRQAHLHEQLQLFFSEDRVLVGFVTWALLSSQTEARILRSGNPELHPSEWNEGDSLWLIDTVALPGRLKYISRVLHDETFADFNRVRFVRLRKGRVSVHEVFRRRPTSIIQDLPTRLARTCRCGLPVSDCLMNR